MISPSDHRSAFSEDSARRDRSLTLSRSITISMSCLTYRSSTIASSVLRIVPSTLTRAYPSLFKSLKSCWYVPFFCLTTGARIVIIPPDPSNLSNLSNLSDPPDPPDPPHSDAIVSAIRSGDCDSILTSWTGQCGTPILAKSRRR